MPTVYFRAIAFASFGRWKNAEYKPVEAYRLDYSPSARMISVRNSAKPWSMRSKPPLNSVFHDLNLADMFAVRLLKDRMYSFLEGQESEWQLAGRLGIHLGSLLVDVRTKYRRD